VVRLTPTIVEVIVEAPAAARHFSPGQFYRLQNFESMARRVDDVPLLMEGIALTGAWVDKERGLLSMIALELGVSSRLVTHLQPGEPVVVMGPTGAPTEIPDGRNVLLLGGGLGNAVLFSIAKAMREHGNRGDLFRRLQEGRGSVQARGHRGGHPSGDLEHRPRRGDSRRGGRRTRISAATSSRRCSRTRTASSASGWCRSTPWIGSSRSDSDRMMAAVTAARRGVLAPHLKPEHVGIASINSPMQCMMKEVCAQCLQKHVDPKTGRESIIFSCFNQDQDMDRVDFANLAARLRQNTVQEKLASLWLDHLLQGARLAGG